MPIRFLAVIILCLFSFSGVMAADIDSALKNAGVTKTVTGPTVRFTVETVPLERAGVKLYLQKLTISGDNPTRQILLAHGLTYSSHEFDVDVADYSLARYLARRGFCVWTVDVAGYGRSAEVKDGFLPNSAYAAEDLAAAAARILELTGQKKLDVLGWSWGTVTGALFAINHPEMVNKLVLYAPILTGLGQADVKAPFNHNTWEHAAGDFQLGPDGQIDYAIAEPAVVNAFQSNAWRYDKESSPNGGRRELLVKNDEILIPFDKIKVPTLVIGGDKDPYLNLPALEREIAKLPEGSEFAIIPGAAHAMMMEKPYYKRFRNNVVEFLRESNRKAPVEVKKDEDMRMDAKQLLEKINRYIQDTKNYF